MQKAILKKFAVPAFGAGMVLLMTGCAGGPSFTKVGTTASGERVAITKEDVHAKTVMSDTIFLEPVAPEQQIIYFKIRNTSDEDLDINRVLKERFERIGFRVTTNPKKANFMVQANILKVGVMDENEQKNYLGAGFGGAGIGALAGAATAGGGGQRAAGGALIGMAIGLALEAARVDDVHYAMVTDIEIRQRALAGETVNQTDNLSSRQGSTGSSNQTVIIDNVQWKKYRTRIVSSAYAPGLEFQQARPFLEDGLAKSLAGTM